jgi:hypothetical protein
MAMQFTIPGTLGPNIEVRRTMMGGVQLIADGQRLKRHGWLRGYYSVQASDGNTYEVRLNRGLTALKVRIGDTEIALERPLTGWEIALVILPVGVLVFLGGILGAVLGAIAAEINRRLARSEMRAPSRAGAMVGVGLVSAALYLAGSVAIAVVLLGQTHYEAGSCLTDIRDRGGYSVADARTVDCALPHDGEVVANIEAPDGDYPGEDGLLLFGSFNCRGPFEDYVGRSYDDSRLDMVVFWPSHVMWLTGDHAVDCIAVDPEGDALLGSVRGSAR